MAAYAAVNADATTRRKQAVQRLRAAAMAADLLHQATQAQGLPEPVRSPERTPGRPVVTGGQDGVLHAQPPYRPSLADAKGLDPGLGPALAGARGYARGLQGLRPYGVEGQGSPDYHPPRGPVDMSHDVVRHLVDELTQRRQQQEGQAQGRGQVSGRGQVPMAGNLATGRPYQQPPEAHMPERRPTFGGPKNGRPNLGNEVRAYGHGDGSNGPVPIPGAIFNGGRPPADIRKPPQLPGRPQVNPLEEQLAQRAAQVNTQQRRRRRPGAGALVASILG